MSIGRILWRSTYDPPLWWLVVSTLNSVLAVVRLAATGHDLLGRPSLSIFFSLVCAFVTFWFYLHPIHYPFEDGIAWKFR